MIVTRKLYGPLGIRKGEVSRWEETASGGLNLMGITFDDGDAGLVLTQPASPDHPYLYKITIRRDKKETSFSGFQTDDIARNPDRYVIRLGSHLLTKEKSQEDHVEYEITITMF